MVHGFGEHAGRYGALQRAFLDSATRFGAADLRGHGRSPGRAGTSTAGTTTATTRPRSSGSRSRSRRGRPVFLFGHSMGGLIVLDLALHRPTASPASSRAARRWCRAAGAGR